MADLSDWQNIHPLDNLENFSLHGLNLAFDSWIQRAETVSANALMVEGSERERMCNRVRGPKFCWQPALGRPGSGSSKLSAITVAWKNVSVWLSDVILAQRPGTSLSVAGKASRARWHIRFHTWDHLGDNAHASAFLNWVQKIERCHLTCRLSLCYLHWYAKLVANRATQHDIQASQRAYRVWLADGPSAGLSKLHRMTRIQTG